MIVLATLPRDTRLCSVPSSILNLVCTEQEQDHIVGCPGIMPGSGIPRVYARFPSTCAFFGGRQQFH